MTKGGNNIFGNQKDYFSQYKSTAWDSKISKISSNACKVLFYLMRSSNLRERTNALIFRNNGHPLKQSNVVKATDLSPATVSRCFKELTSMGILASRREICTYDNVARTIYYLSPEVVHVGYKPTRKDMELMPFFHADLDFDESELFA